MKCFNPFSNGLFLSFLVSFLVGLLVAGLTPTASAGGQVVVDQSDEANQTVANMMTIFERNRLVAIKNGICNANLQTDINCACRFIDFLEQPACVPYRNCVRAEARDLAYRLPENEVRRCLLN